MICSSQNLASKALSSKSEPSMWVKEMVREIRLGMCSTSKRFRSVGIREAVDFMMMVDAALV